jgi:hypothetical protein
MAPMSEADASPDERREEGPEHFDCDFCGKQVPRVRRVALDRGYDRLQKPHPVRYACDACSAEKERERIAHPGG